MSKKSRISFEIKIKYVQNYLAGKISISDVCKELNITRWAFYLWITKYDSSGAEGLCQTSQNTKYPKEIKNFAVEDYLLGRGTLLDICKKYNISSEYVLRNWIKLYNTNKELKDYDPKPEVYMADTLKVSKEKKIEIIKYCIDNNNYYKVIKREDKAGFYDLISTDENAIENGENSGIDVIELKKVFENSLEKAFI